MRERFKESVEKMEQARKDYQKELESEITLEFHQVLEDMIPDDLTFEQVLALEPMVMDGKTKKGKKKK